MTANVCSLLAENVDFAVIKTHLSLGFRWNALQLGRSRRSWIRRWSQFGNEPQDAGEELSQNGDLGHPKKATFGNPLP